MPTQRDYYSILQVNPATSQEAIDAAYARLSKAYDPDVSKKRKASERKQELDEAYEVLSDKKRRAEYDRLRSKGWRPGQAEETGEGAGGILGLLGNPYVFAGLAASGVIIILVAIVLISLLDDSNPSDSVANLSPTATVPVASTPTLPAQSPTTAPEAPPEITGDEIATASGLKYVDVLEGTGASPKTGDTVVVNYTGWTQADGKKFDSSLESSAPFSFPLGAGRVIEGWDEGVATMKVGGKRRLLIPAELGYGEAGRPPSIPGGATLIFDIELLDIFPAATPVPTAAPTPAPSTSADATPTASP